MNYLLLDNVLTKIDSKEKATDLKAKLVEELQRLRGNCFFHVADPIYQSEFNMYVIPMDVRTSGHVCIHRDVTATEGDIHKTLCHIKHQISLRQQEEDTLFNSVPDHLWS